MPERPENPVPGVAPYDGAAGGWDALKSVTGHLRRQHVLLKGNRTLLGMNKPDGFDCPGCAWPDPEHAGSFEYCENGAKAVAWEATEKRAGPSFFAKYTLAELRQKSDHWLEDQGRLTRPLRYDAQTDRYEPISWDEAYLRIGQTLRALDHPDEAEFYASGRTSNEAAFLYQLLGRAFGTNNFPDCSNMCHEPTSVGLPKSIGVGKGTVTLEDFEHCDLILSFGHNPGTNHPRMLGTLRAAVKRGTRIVVFNPLRERGLERFADPQSPVQMLSGTSTDLACDYLQLRVGGDAAVVKGMMKALIAADTADGDILDHAFIETHTHGFDAMKADLQATSWAEIEAVAGLAQSELERAATTYASAKSVILCYGMGLTQHHCGTANVQQLANLLLLRGNIGRPGAGLCPVRGHSNVQGDRTMGIAEKPASALLDAMERTFHLPMPRKNGHTVVEAVEALRDGRARVLIGLGGNLVKACSDTHAVEEAMREAEMTVWIATKLNRSHIVHGREALLLPCLGRTELDVQASGPQSITVEDSMSMVHASLGMNTPASPDLRSEPAIVVGIAKATLGQVEGIDWDALIADYDRIRDLVAEVIPGHEDYNARIRRPGGFHLPNPASERVWNTPTGKANFLVHDGLLTDPGAPTPNTLTLTTMRSHDQYNTTIYGMDDRYRGITGRRDILFMNEADIAALDLTPGDRVDISARCAQPERYTLSGWTVVAHSIPRGCCAAYFPEANVLIPLENRDPESLVPAYKSVPVQVRRSDILA